MTSPPIPGAMRRAVRNPLGVRLEGAALVLILLAVGGAAGAASFTHVHDWTMNNSLPGTGDWFGWANAVISELVPIAALLVIRRRRRTAQPVSYPAFLLITALTFSITAQLAVAKGGLSGGLVSVVPALAFAALAKLILGKDPPPDPTHQPSPPHTHLATAPIPVLPTIPATTPHPAPAPAPALVAGAAASPVVMSTPVTDTVTAVRDDQPQHPSSSSPNTDPIPARYQASAPVPVQGKTLVAGGVKTAVTGAPLPAVLLDRARQAATDFVHEHARPITRDELRAVLRVSNSTTGDVMRVLGLADARTLATTATMATAVSPLTGNPLLPTP